MDEVMALAGAHHITIAPPLLRELSTTEASGYDSKIPNVFDVEVRYEQLHALMSFADNEAAFRTALSNNDNGSNEAKMIQVCSIRRFLSLLRLRHS